MKDLKKKKKKLWYIHTMFYHLAIKKEQSTDIGIIWMNLKT